MTAQPAVARTGNIHFHQAPTEDAGIPHIQNTLSDSTSSETDTLSTETRHTVTGTTLHQPEGSSQQQEHGQPSWHDKAIARTQQGPRQQQQNMCQLLVSWDELGSQYRALSAELENP